VRNRDIVDGLDDCP